MFMLRYPARIGLAAVGVTLASLAMSGTDYIRSDYGGPGLHTGKEITGSFEHARVSEGAARALEQSHCREINKQQGDQIKSFHVYRTDSNGWFRYRATCR
jgi:hypothetical protein